jgi:hypothetical protein
MIEHNNRVRQIEEIFSIMEGFEIPYYYVWGLPFRESTLSFFQEDFTKQENGEKITLKSTQGNWTWETNMTKKGWKLFSETEEFLSSLKFGTHLKRQENVKVGDYWLTSSDENLPKQTIVVKHHYRKLIPEALIQLDGHLHFGQHVQNYLNLGFLYRDAAHSASPMIGCYWELNLKGSNVEVSFRDLGGNLKEYVCPKHPKEGIFYIPNYWKRCPICYEPKQAIIQK